MALKNTPSSAHTAWQWLQLDQRIVPQLLRQIGQQLDSPMATLLNT